jgi:hypothetical protein
MGYPESMNLLRSAATSPRAGWRLTSRTCHRGELPGCCSPGPDALSDAQRSLLAGLTGACPEMTSLAALVRSFAALLRPDPANSDNNWNRDTRPASPRQGAAIATHALATDAAG